MDNYCRICMNNSYSYSPIFEEEFLKDFLLFEVINDVCQLDVYEEDGLPKFICYECYTKISEFQVFKRQAHEVTASLQQMKDESTNYLNIKLENLVYEGSSGDYQADNLEDYARLEPEVRVKLEGESFGERSSECALSEDFDEYMEIEPEVMVDPVKVDYGESNIEYLDPLADENCTGYREDGSHTTMVMCDADVSYFEDGEMNGDITASSQANASLDGNQYLYIIMPKGRKSYTAQTKLEIVNYAELHGNRPASRYFHVSESSVREWRSQKDVLNEMPNNKKARRKRNRGRGKPPLDKTDLEEMAIPRGRKTYSTQAKLEMVKYAETHGNRPASRYFDVPESCIREWRSQKELFGEVQIPRRGRRKRELWGRSEQGQTTDVGSAVISLVRFQSENRQ